MLFVFFFPCRSFEFSQNRNYKSLLSPLGWLRGIPAFRDLAKACSHWRAA